MNAPIKLAALFAGALLVLAQTSGAAEAGHGRKQVRTDDRQNQAVRIWDQDRSHKQGKAYDKRRRYGNDGDRHGKAYSQRRYYGNDGDRHGKAYSQRRQYGNDAYRNGKRYGQRRYYSNDGYRHGKAYGRRTQRRYAGAGQWQHQGRQHQGRQNQGWQNQGWQNQGWQYQAQRQRPRQNSDGRIASHRQRNQVWRGDQTYLDHSHGN